MRIWAHNRWELRLLQLQLCLGIYLFLGIAGSRIGNMQLAGTIIDPLVSAQVKRESSDGIGCIDGNAICLTSVSPFAGGRDVYY